MSTLSMPIVTTDHSIFSMLRHPGSSAGAADAATIRPHRWSVLALLVLAAWAGGVGFFGRYRPSQVSRMLYQCVPAQVNLGGWTLAQGEVLLACGALLAALILIAGLARGDRPLAGAGGMVLAYLLGFALYDRGFAIVNEWTGMRPYVRHAFPMRAPADGLAFARNRIAFALPLVMCMLAARLLLLRRTGLFHFGWGDWRVTSRDFSMKGDKQSYARMMFPSFALCSGGLMVLMLSLVGFGPVLSGNLWPLLPALLVAALANATIEEVIYRGFMLPAFVNYGGVAAGLWMQGLLFGLVHWGMSVGVLAALPVSLLIGLGSVMWGKAALETRGLGWVIVAHFMIDVAIMAAYFVPGTAAIGGS